MQERAGRFEILGGLAGGGMGDVFVARSSDPQEDDRLLAVKRLKPELVDRPSYVQMFLDEARLGLLMRHENLARTVELGREGDDYFIVMEFVDGPHLSKVVSTAATRGQALPIDLCVYIAARAADGLHAAHELLHPKTGEPLNLVHRDVSPQNILVSFNGDVKVIDFGVARAVTNLAHTGTGQLKGKLSYMAPEQCLGEKVDRRTDIFALGIVAHELLARRKLYAGPSEYAVMDRIIQQPVEPPSCYSSKVPAALDEVVLRALAKDPNDRYASADELARALDRWLGREEAAGGRANLARWLALHAEELQPSQRFDQTVSLPRPVLRIASLDDAAKIESLLARVLRSEEEAEELDRGPVASIELPPEELLSPPPKQQQRTNLVAPRTSFIGRSAEIARLRELVEAGHSPLTIIGPGGTGKTRLAQQLALLCLEDDRCELREAWFCDLTEAVEIDDICAAVSRALGMPPADASYGTGTVERIGHALAERGPLIVVLDNFERVTKHASSTVGRWIRLAPEARFVVTSRERTHLTGEVLYELGPLSVPTGDDRSAAADSVQLFLDRASAVLGGGELPADDLPLVARIAQALEGIPLAIELAAARMRVLSPAQILERLSKQLDLLRGGPRDTTGRQRTLRGALDWSWNLLDAAERDALAQCSVFHGGFTPEAAEAVLEPRGAEGDAEVLDLLQALRDKSLLRTIAGSSTGSGIRFALYEMVRQYAEERLDPEARLAVEARHSRYYASIAEQLRAELARGSGGAALVGKVSFEAENLIAVLRREAGEGASRQLPRSVLSVAHAFEPLAWAGHSYRGLVDLLDVTLPPERIERSIAAAPRATAAALHARAHLKMASGLLAEAQTDLARALGLAQGVEDRQLEGAIYLELGTIRRTQGRIEQSSSHFRRAYKLATEVGDKRLEAQVLVGGGLNAADRGDHDQALARFGRAHELGRRTGDTLVLAEALANLGPALVDTFDFAGAERSLRAAITLNQQIGNQERVAYCHGVLGVAAYLRGRFTEALEEFESASKELLAIGAIRFGGIFLASKAAAAAKLGITERCEEDLDHAQALIEQLGNPPFLATIHLLRGLVDVARGREAQAAGEERAARRYFQRARARATSLPETDDRDAPALPAVLASSQAARFAMTALRRELDELGG